MGSSESLAAQGGHAGTFELDGVCYRIVEGSLPEALEEGVRSIRLDVAERAEACICLHGCILDTLAEAAGGGVAPARRGVLVAQARILLGVCRKLGWPLDRGDIAAAAEDAGYGDGRAVLLAFDEAVEGVRR